MQQILAGILRECWIILADSAPYVLFGFLAAGVLKALMPEDAVARHLGKKGAVSVLKASLIGIPLPLCSCGVIPAAVGLRKQGASKGASAAFLVSVPETGVDSIAITWALLDPVMTVLRPLAALVTAVVAGVAIDRLPEEAAPPYSVQNGCGCGDPSPPSKAPLRTRLREGVAYAFGELLRDIGKWLMLGIAVAAVISYLVPEAFFTRFLENELISMLLMLAVGIPLYVCASASTPVAAALVLKGLSPGAALVFLLAGPATNAATISIVGRFWGKRAAAVYLAAIALCSFVLGWLTNRIYDWSGADITRWISDAHMAESPWGTAAALLLLTLFSVAHLPHRRRDPCAEEPGGG